MTTRALEAAVDLVELGTWIHEKNRPSQDMARRFQMRHTGMSDAEGLQRWATLLLVAGAEDGL
jgi:hypothetical protein